MGPFAVDIIFLDAGGTLLYPEPGVGEVYARAARARGVTAPPAVLEDAFRQAFRAKKALVVPQDREWWREVVHHTFRLVGPVADPDGLFDELYDHFAAPSSWRLYPDVSGAISELSARGLRLGILSNWDDRLRGLLKGLGLLPGLDPIVVSGEIGAEKPDPRIYRTALDAAGVPPGLALVVGDDREADVKGPRAAGMHAVHLDRRGGAPDSIVGLDRLPDLVGEPRA